MEELINKLSEEEKKAIEKLNYYNDLKIVDLSLYYLDMQVVSKTIINLIEKQQEQLQEKDKIINLMAEVLNDFDYDKQCESCPTNICSASVDETGYTKCIIEYFTKKAREV